VSSSNSPKTPVDAPGNAVVYVAILVCGIWAAANATSLATVISYFVLGATGGLAIGAIIASTITPVANFVHGNNDRRRGGCIHFKSTSTCPRGFFLICDPAGMYRILDNGEVASARGVVVEDAVVPVTALMCAILALAYATSFAMGIVFLALSAVTGLIIGKAIAPAIVAAANSARMKSDQRRGRDIYLEITEDNPQAWRLCSTVAKLGEVESWAYGIVDPTRRALSILWLAVRRSMALDLQYADAIKASSHPSLEDLAKETLSRIDQERQLLNEVEVNLNQVLATSTSIDQMATEKKLAEQYQQEERELRGRLANYNAIAAPQASQIQADRSVGLAVETKVIAHLLAESDRILRQANR
jgi:hypothetical protein